MPLYIAEIRLAWRASMAGLPTLLIAMFGIALPPWKVRFPVVVSPLA